MAKRLLETANFWAEQLRLDDKEVREALEGREPDGTRGTTQATWYLSTVYEALNSQGASSVLDAAKERARKDKEAADKLALENAETRGDVARISVMAEEVAAVLGDHRTNALGIPSKAAPHLVGLNADQIRDRLEGYVHELLSGLADYRPGARKKRGAGGTSSRHNGGEATAEADSQPVG